MKRANKWWFRFPYFRTLKSILVNFILYNILGQNERFFYAFLAAIGIYCWKPIGDIREKMCHAAIGANSTRRKGLMNGN